MTALQKLRADIDAAKAVAVARFEQDWGTRDPRVAVEALRVVLPRSRDWKDAANKAATLVKGSA